SGPACSTARCGASARGPRPTGNRGATATTSARNEIAQQGSVRLSAAGIISPSCTTATWLWSRRSHRLPRPTGPSGRSVVRPDPSPRLLDDLLRLAPGEHAVFQGFIPCGLQPRVLLDQRLRPLVQRGAGRRGAEPLVERPGGEAGDRHQTDDGSDLLVP